MSILQWLSHLSLDIVCLQETHITSPNECSAWFSSYGYMSVSPGTNHSCGVVVLYRPCYYVTKTWIEPGGRFVMLEFSHHNVVFRVACLYAPNRNPARDDFFASRPNFIDPSVPTIVCGDLNAVLNRSLDRRCANMDVSRESCQTLLSLFQNCCVVDIWRVLHPTSVAFTWQSPDGLASSRIDHFGVPYSWLHHVVSCEHLPCPFSDHCAVLLDTPIPEPIPRGPRRWKLNTSILSDLDFVEEITSFWGLWKLQKTSFPNIKKWWDQGKKEIKGLAVRHCRRKSTNKNMLRDILVNLSLHLKKHIDMGRTSFLSIYESVQSRIAAIVLQEAQGARVRSRTKWAEEGETSSSYFVRLEKKHGAEDWILAMRREDGSIVSDITNICNSWVSFYSTLFTACQCDIDIQNELLSKVASCVPPDQVGLCEGYLSLEEVQIALSGMARGKSPGSDGLPAEFYITFWDVLGAVLIEVVNASLDAGSLALSQKEALISLIFKKGDRLEHKNWRPISLLNVDYKLCARALAGRLLKVLNYVILPDQTCGVKGRFIGGNVAFLRDVSIVANELNLSAAILSLDQEKAFDRVDWRFLLSTLRHMGFGESFVKWVQLLYTDIRSAVLIDGYTSNWFKPSRGVRQGCPLSPLLYVISIEVLAANIRTHPRITGIRLPNLPSSLPVVSLYADDTSIVVSSDPATLAVFETYSLFKRGTGSKLNVGKCEGLWLGSWRNRLDAPVPILWNSDKIKILGVYIGNGDMDEANWRPRIQAVEKCLASWRSRSLSLSGRVLIINALALSRIWYVASLVVIPSWAKMELNTLIFNFFWGGKRDLVARNVIIHPKDMGGFSMVSIELKVYALSIQWVRRLFSSSNGWISLLTFWFFDRFGVGPSVVFADPFRFSPDLLPAFYRSLLYAWRLIGGASSPTGLVIGSLATSGPLSIAIITSKVCYNLLVSMSPCAPATWFSLFFFPLDRTVIDLNWKIAHGVLYTADRLISFGYNIPALCFCGLASETHEHLFFSCPLAQSGI